MDVKPRLKKSKVIAGRKTFMSFDFRKKKTTPKLQSYSTKRYEKDEILVF